MRLYSVQAALKNFIARFGQGHKKMAKQVTICFSQYNLSLLRLLVFVCGSFLPALCAMGMGMGCESKRRPPHWLSMDFMVGSSRQYARQDNRTVASDALQQPTLLAPKRKHWIGKSRSLAQTCAALPQDDLALGRTYRRKVVQRC